MQSTRNKLNNLKILSFNAQGIRNKYNELEHLALQLDLDTIFIQETKLNQTKPQNLPNYNIINKANGQIYGLLIYIKSNIEYTEINIHTHSYESAGIKIGNINIFNVYSSPSLKLNVSDLDSLFRSNSKVIIIGDHNAKHRKWNNFNANRNGTILDDYINKNNVHIAYPQNSPTLFPDNGGSPSVIDFAIYKNCFIDTTETAEDLNSDHLPVLFNIKLNDYIETINKQIIKTNWEVFRENVNKEIKINCKIINKFDINTEIKNFSKTINSCFERATSKKQIPMRTLTLPASIVVIIKHKNYLRRVFQRLRDPAIKTEINKITNIINNEISNIKAEKWNNELKKITPKNPSNLWRIARALKRNKNKQKMPAIQSENGLVYSNSEKAESIAKHFYRVHKQTENMSNDSTKKHVEKVVQHLFKNKHIKTPNTDLTSPKEIINIIKQLNIKKAPGDDQISNHIIKNLPKKAIVSLYYIFNSCLKNQYFPMNWKNAIVLPFIKPNKNPSHAASYRPISLLPQLSKILEKIILVRLKNHEDENKCLIPEQFGFRTNASTVHQLVRITEIITTNFNINKVTSLMTLDIEKAFDTVWHNALIYKLIKYHIPNHLIKIIHSFLINRTFQVKIGDTLSVKHKIQGGVPQGAILSPQLFLYFINDIPKHSKTKIALFCDDTAIIAESWQQNQNNKYIQEHTNELEKYFHKWKIKINPDKTTITHFSKKGKQKVNTHVTLNKKIINVTDSVKYLGMQLDKKLNYNKHINEIKQKAGYSLTILYPLLTHTSALATKLKLYMYKAYIRPIFMYAAPIFNTTSSTNIKKLQIIQNKILRLILNAKYNTKISDLHKKANEISNIPYIIDLINNTTEKFFNIQINKNALTKTIPLFTNENAPFKIKSKQPHYNIKKVNK